MEPTTIEGWKAYVYDMMAQAEQCNRNIQIANQKIQELSKPKEVTEDKSDV